MRRCRLNPRATCTRYHRCGYSLLEVLIATAVLAGSAMLLSSMIARGARAGSEATRRTIGMGVATSVMDELIAMRRFDPAEQKGVVGTEEPWAWRAKIEPEPTFGMIRIVVEAIEDRGGGSEAWNGSESLNKSIRLVRWTRAPRDPRVALAGSREEEP